MGAFSFWCVQMEGNDEHHADQAFRARPHEHVCLAQFDVNFPEKRLSSICGMVALVQFRRADDPVCEYNGLWSFFGLLFGLLWGFFGLLFWGFLGFSWASIGFFGASLASLASLAAG